MEAALSRHPAVQAAAWCVAREDRPGDQSAWWPTPWRPRREPPDAPRWATLRSDAARLHGPVGASSGCHRSRSRQRQGRPRALAGPAAERPSSAPSTSPPPTPWSARIVRDLRRGAGLRSGRASATASSTSAATRSWRCARSAACSASTGLDVPVIAVLPAPDGRGAGSPPRPAPRPGARHRPCRRCAAERGADATSPSSAWRAASRARRRRASSGRTSATARTRSPSSPRRSSTRRCRPRSGTTRRTCGRGASLEGRRALRRRLLRHHARRRPS